mmetsp:Transcript_22141/g.25623  ORF Transcript_22141/g.25623 Transcript_22141/m.25623 type:complete len:90 (-) Transcript_22141:1830-2099(-)
MPLQTKYYAVCIILITVVPLEPKTIKEPQPNDLSTIMLSSCCYQQPSRSTLPPSTTIKPRNKTQLKVKINIQNSVFERLDDIFSLARPF